MGIHVIAILVALTGTLSFIFGLVLIRFAIPALVRRRVAGALVPTSSAIDRLRNLSTKQAYGVIAAAAWHTFLGVYTMISLMHHFGFLAPTAIRPAP
jgi:hypothetical protein